MKFSLVNFLIRVHSMRFCCILGGNGSSNLSGSTGVVAGGSGNSSNTGNGWGDPREIRPLAGGGSMDIRNVDHRGGNGSGGTSSDPRDIRMIDPRDPIRGDPRGISGRLNGTSEMWGHHPQMSHNQIQNRNQYFAIQSRLHTTCSKSAVITNTSPSR